MDGKHPIRKKDKDNPYELTVENEEYYVAFSDGQGVHHKERINQELYDLFDRFELEDISQLNVISRYQEHLELTEGALNQRALIQPESIEDGVYRKIIYDQLHTAIGKLPDIQRRRVLLYYFGGFTYERIAEMEGCTKMAVKFSIDIAIKKLRKRFWTI